jgi:hypothetical protein
MHVVFQTHLDVQEIFFGVGGAAKAVLFATQ